MFCFITFNRSVICTPATIAIGLFMLSCLFFYESVEKNSTKLVIISALCLFVNVLGLYKRYMGVTFSDI
jgi:hypothetical protein